MILSFSFFLFLFSFILLFFDGLGRWDCQGLGQGVKYMHIIDLIVVFLVLHHLFWIFKVLRHKLLQFVFPFQSALLFYL